MTVFNLGLCTLVSLCLYVDKVSPYLCVVLQSIQLPVWYYTGLSEDDL